jgi:hypothetical protein
LKAVLVQVNADTRVASCSVIHINAARGARFMVLPAETRRHPLSRENLILTIPLEKLAYLITKAREFGVEVLPVDKQSGSNPSDDAEWEVIETSAGNPAYQELVNAIDSLNDPSVSSCRRWRGSAAGTMVTANGVKHWKRPAASMTKKRRTT